MTWNSLNDKNMKTHTISAAVVKSLTEVKITMGVFLVCKNTAIHLL